MCMELQEVKGGPVPVRLDDLRQLAAEPERRFFMAGPEL